MKRLFGKEFKIGLTVVIALTVLFFGINYLKGVNIFKAANYYYAYYDEVQGLAVSAPVTLNGFQVGLVREIEYDYNHPGHVIVEISLDRKLVLPEGTVASLSADILGTASIALQLGAGQQTIAVGDTLESRTVPSMVDALSKDVMPNVSGIFARLDTLLVNVNALVSHPALEQALTRIDAITGELETASQQLALMTKQLAPLPGKISPILNDVNGITTNVETIASDLTVLSGRLREAPIDSMLTSIEATTANLKALSEQLNDPRSTLGQLMNNPALYDNLNRTVSSLDSLFVDIKRNPKRYVTVKVF